MDESGLLQLCPLCDYRLEGLPVEYRCPECGFELDRRWEVFGGGKRTPARRLTLWLLLATIISVLIGSVVVALLRKATPWFPLMLTPTVIVILAGLRPRRHFYALGHLELRVYRARTLVATYPLQRIDRIQHRYLRQQICIDVADQPITWPDSWFFVNDPGEPHRLVLAVQQRLAPFRRRRALQEELRRAASGRR